MSLIVDAGRASGFAAAGTGGAAGGKVGRGYRATGRNDGGILKGVKHVRTSCSDC